MSASNEFISSSSHSSPVTKKPRRHPEFWFNDGSVVLLAHDVLFRVHKSFLARHSLIFRDMFSLPQPKSAPTTAGADRLPDVSNDVCNDASSNLPDDLLDEREVENGEVVLDGCPVVSLHDSPDDVASLLYALYDGPKFGDNSVADFRVVSGILRLASKYMIDGLRKCALEHLSTAWPSTLKGWDAREEIAGDYAEEERFYPNPVEVINLAQEVNASNLLPSAFYDLSRYPLSEVFTQHNQRTSPTPRIHPLSHLAYVPPSLPSYAELSLADAQRLALGKESSQQAVTSLIRSLATEARSNPSHTSHSHHSLHPSLHASATASSSSQHRTSARRFAARHQHRRSDSTNGLGRCTSPASCWRDVCELVDLATQHYLFDRERGATDPLYVAEELALLKGSPDSYVSPESTNNRDARTDLAGPSTVSGGGASNVWNTLDEDLGEPGTCRACARAFEVWSTKERERLWRAIPTWFKLDM